MFDVWNLKGGHFPQTGFTWPWPWPPFMDQLSRLNFVVNSVSQKLQAIGQLYLVWGKIVWCTCPVGSFQTFYSWLYGMGLALCWRLYSDLLLLTTMDFNNFLGQHFFYLLWRNQIYIYAFKIVIIQLVFALSEL